MIKHVAPNAKWFSSDSCYIKISIKVPKILSESTLGILSHTLNWFKEEGNHVSIAVTNAEKISRDMLIGQI